MPMAWLFSILSSPAQQVRNWNIRSGIFLALTGLSSVHCSWSTSSSTCWSARLSRLHLLESVTVSDPWLQSILCHPTVIRTDWFEHSNNHTLDSDASWEVASIGQIFFPDQINAQVRKQSDYLPLSGLWLRFVQAFCHHASSCLFILSETLLHLVAHAGPPVVNSDDPIFRAQSEAWLARTDYNVSHPAKSLRFVLHLEVPSMADSETDLVMRVFPELRSTYSSTPTALTLLHLPLHLTCVRVQRKILIKGTVHYQIALHDIQPRLSHPSFSMYRWWGFSSASLLLT